MIPEKYWAFVNTICRLSIASEIDVEVLSRLEDEFYQHIYTERESVSPPSLIDSFDKMFEEIRSIERGNRLPIVRQALAEILPNAAIASHCPLSMTLFLLSRTIQKDELHLDDLRALKECPWRAMSESAPSKLASQIESAEEGIEWLIEDFDEGFYDTVSEPKIKRKLETLFDALRSEAQ